MVPVYCRVLNYALTYRGTKSTVQYEYSTHSRYFVQVRSMTFEYLYLVLVPVLYYQMIRTSTGTHN